MTKFKGHRIRKQNAVSHPLLQLLSYSEPHAFISTAPGVSLRVG